MGSPLPPLLWALCVLSATGADDSWTVCPAACKCNWVSGKRSADCNNASLTAVPANLSSEIQHVDLSRNQLSALPADAFASVRLVNVHRLRLRWCGIYSVHKRAFAGLGVLTSLDLSHNAIATLHPSTFRDTVRLTELHLSDNPLRKLDDGLFNNLLYLQMVEVADCQLAYVGLKTFLNVPKLNTLKLSNNNLTAMRPAVFEQLNRSLRGLELYGNPWNCNCNLRSFIEWVVDRKLYTSPTSCQEPPSLRGRSWLDLTSEELACRPQIAVFPTVVEVPGGDVTMACRSSGTPAPVMHWVFDSRIIGDLPGKYTLENAVAGARWLNLTVWDVTSRDAGDYLCVAKSPGGVEERSVLLKVVGGGLAGGAAAVGGLGTGTLALIVGLVVGAAAFMVVAALVLLVCCRRKGRRRKDAAGAVANGDVPRQASAHEEKFPLTAVNPVQKPPRRIERSGDLAGATDCTDECNLLDSGSTYKPGSMTDSDDRLEGRSVDSLDKSLDGLDSASLRSDGAGHHQHHHRAYPPDLLAFPPRASAAPGGGQASPAASSASTAPDSSRLPPQSPAGPPPHLLLFGTLPYSRSQSPFSVVQPRRHQGYVTIPRRPRVPSWGGGGGDPHDALEPVYDNLGPRTTADGSSLLSLNKVLEATTPAMRGRPLPATPTSPLHCPPIREQPSPAPVHRVASPASWGRASPEGASPARRPLDHSTPIGGGRDKVPPRPPPKPRKAAEAPGAPLFEDEGEDGTEV